MVKIEITFIQLSYPSKYKGNLWLTYLLHYRAFHDVQLRIFTDVFGKAYKMSKMIDKCKVISDFRRLEGLDSKNYYYLSSPKCEKNLAKIATAE